ncbi:hypothetical protein K443DRAFT_673421 [Laccaria amethystina LaAM-08-1]|uniref:Proteasome activator PA28 C-terminal domain-containing protein n=1 Tax=Laccaria amethystina LaAM-08-1 TaxID=1095629 RepID=A0A0C9XRB6_9AGAR|nr:hypothetical protein K443DRAFT_673421 [Laccaria amethystina LaAM-08-1]
MIQTTSNPNSPFHIPSSTDTTIYPPPTPISDDVTYEANVKKRKRLSEGGGSEHARVLNDSTGARSPQLVHSNSHILNVHEIIKRQCEDLVTLTDQVKLWVTLAIPKIEDGNNFGVQVQEEVLGELQRAQESAFNLRDTARQDYLARAKICSKLIKYPNVEDYSLALKEHDDKQQYLANQHLRDIRNMYATLTDVLHKNISKIRVPKANNTAGLY